ncbi:hypothetical protein BSR28_04695 [Boudabousia liubingyangii]|uniref:hypothetical protein n=1 Tax=Boudabousia liubingyangii TaxID=1921764 RepID=UPI000939D774|nr:hypothetical protein [Boudabousia liubingyangii]OKL46749.1 hypothetical protein BSR28_04695 [Boudabousia liubingyangii]
MANNHRDNVPPQGFNGRMNDLSHANQRMASQSSFKAGGSWKAALQSLAGILAIVAIILVLIYT